MQLITGIVVGLFLGYAVAVSAQYLDPLDPPFINGIPLYERIDQELAYQGLLRDRWQPQPMPQRRPCD